MIFLIPIMFLAAIYAIVIATVGTDYLKWFFTGINYDVKDINHKRRDERDRVIGIIILIMIIIMIVSILF